MPETLTLGRRGGSRTETVGARIVSAIRSYWTGTFTLKDPALNRIHEVYSRSTAGTVVTEATMFACAAVFDAVNQIASDVAKLPLDLKIRRNDGGSDDYVASKTYKLLKYQPNPEQTSMVFRRQLLTHALVTKGGFAEIERDNAGRPVALWPLEPHRVQPFHDTSLPGSPLRYRIDGDTVLDARNVIHLRGLSWDGVCGMEMVHVAREAIGLALASQQFASAFFGNGTRFGGVLSSDEDLTEEQAEEIQSRIEKLHQRADKAFRLLVLGAGFKFTESGVKPNEAQMREIRDQQVEEVARFYNMPLHKLKLSRPGAVSYASVEMADLDYYKGTLLNWITLFEEELNSKLISPLEIGRQYVKHNVNALLRGDIRSRYEALGIARDKGIINADEWRALEDMNPQEGGQGKLYLVQSAQIPVDLLAEKVRAEIDKLTEPPPAQPTPPSEPGAPSEPADDGEAQRALVARLEAAEAAVEAFRQEAQQEREARVALEASGIATAEEIARRVESETAALTKCAQLELLADDLRRQLAAVTAERDAARDEAGALAARLTEAEQAAHDAQVRADASQQAAQAAETDRQAALQRADEATSEADRLRAEYEAAQQALATVLAEREQDAVAIAEAQRALDEARALAEAAEQARDTQVAEAAALTAQCEAAQQAADEAREALTRAEAELEAVRQQAAAAQAQIAELTEARRAAEARQAALEERQAAQTQALEAAQAAQHEADRQFRLTMLGALRGEIVHAMSRIVRREADRARSKQATPEKLRRGIRSFLDVAEAHAVEDLTPAIRTHLAWRRSSEDATVVATRIVQEHLARFSALIDGVLEADPEEFHAVLERQLTRWERDRPDQVADALLVEDLRHV